MKADKISKFLFIFLLSFYNFPSFLTLDNSFIIDSIKNENSKWEDVKNEFAKGQMVNKKKSFMCKYLIFYDFREDLLNIMKSSPFLMTF